MSCQHGPINSLMSAPCKEQEAAHNQLCPVLCSSKDKCEQLRRLGTDSILGYVMTSDQKSTEKQKEMMINVGEGGQ